MKPRAQLTFSSKGEVKAPGKPDATHLAQVRRSFVRARREPLDDHVDVGPVLLTMYNSPCSCSSDLRTNNTKMYIISLKSKHLLSKQIKHFYWLKCEIC